MPASDHPPEDQPKVRSFDPLVMDRTVIAVPLLEQMREDLDLIASVEETHPTASREFNAGIMFNSDFPGGAEAARKRVIELAEKAQELALRSSEKRLAASPQEMREVQKKRAADLKEAVAKQAIAPLEKEGSYSLAFLHAAIIRRLVEMNERLAATKETPPIVRIYPERFEIIIDLNLEYPGGREKARQWVLDNIERAKDLAQVRDPGQHVHLEKDRRESQYVYAVLEARAIQELVELDMDQAKSAAEAIDAAGTDATTKPAAKKSSRKSATKSGSAPAPGKAEPSRFRAIFHIWPDFEVSACINKSIATVKADAAQNSFSASGTGIVWAVLDSGVERNHPHFAKYKNFDVTEEWHKDFTPDGAGPFDDENGHGTHVAGIIAGEWRVPPDAPAGTAKPVAVSRYRKNDTDDIEYQQTELDGVSGMAPRCKLVSLRVLDGSGKGAVSNLIAAIDHVQEINGQGRRLLIHGVNMSLGYNFEPEWFACGQSPLCVEVDRLVRTGVVVVVAAGNTGYGTLKSTIGATSAGIALTINDPGNSDLAITVGSTHRDKPHVYGVSYFSSKGPTGDGRLKPDLVAPGEKIISCATGALKEEGAKNQDCDYVETSGTSMAAPHVSGVIAAFLSVRGEFIGKAAQVKEIFVSTATDLRRDRYFQGAGLVDLMRAIQSV